MAEVDLVGQLSSLGSGATGVFVGLIWVVVIVAAVLGGFVLLQRLLRYNITVEIVERVGDTELTHLTKGRIARWDGVPKIHIKSLKRYESVPRADLFTPIKTLFGWGRMIRFYKSGEALQPLPVSVNSPATLTPFIDSDIELWYSLENQRNYETYNRKTFLEMYGTYVAVGGLFVLVFVMGLIFFEQFGEIAEAFRSSANALAEARSQTINPK